MWKWQRHQSEASSDTWNERKIEPSATIFLCSKLKVQIAEFLSKGMLYTQKGYIYNRNNIIQTKTY